MAIWDQLSEMPVERQLFFGITAVLLSLVIAVLIYLAFFRVQYDVLFSDLRPADASAIVTELETRNIPFELTNGETTILVPEDQVSTTRIAIAGSDLPIKGVVGFELFNESDLGLTEFAQKINYQRALQGELARTIMNLDGIESARVHLAIPERAIFRDERATPKAAVTIHTKPGSTVTSASVEGIQRLVASAVNELALSDVSVLDESGSLISESPNFDEFAVPEIAEKQAVEQYYQARIASALEISAPGRRIKISVRAISMAPDNADVIGNATGDIPSAVDTENSDPLSTERNFRLFVVLTTPTNVGDDDQRMLRQIAEDAIGFDAAIGDRISFSSATVMANEMSNPLPSTGSAAALGQTMQSDPLLSTVTIWRILSWIGVMLLLLLAFFLGLRWFRNRQDHLSAADQDIFASRLKAKLAEDV